MKSSIPDLDLKNEHLTSDDLAGIVVNYIAPVFAGHQLNFAGQPFSQITLLTYFQDAFPPSWHHQAEGIKAIFDEHLPDVEMSPQEIRQIVAQYKKQMPGSRHLLEPILESLSDDPKMVAAQVVAMQGGFSRVKDDKLTLFFRRPPQDATLAQRLAHIPCAGVIRASLW
jgi:hypothetical protein